MQHKRMRDFEQRLREQVRGEVSFDDLTCGIYATDASVYQVRPVAVVAPNDEGDVRAVVRTAGQFGVSVLSRGAGTSLNGQAVNHSVVIDFSKNMNKIIELDVERRWVRVQPGMVLDVLNAKLGEHGLLFAPDPATGDRATIGGMIGNNSSGMRSVVYGMTVDHVLGLRVLLADGTELELEELSAEQYESRCGNADVADCESQIYKGFRQIIKANRDRIGERYPRVMRRVQGYNLDAFVDAERWNPAKLLVGSEGTLGVILEAKLNLVPAPGGRALCIVHFGELLEAIRAVEPILEDRPSAVEIMDEDIISQARRNQSIGTQAEFLVGEPAAVLIVEFSGDAPEQTVVKAQSLAAQLEGQGVGFAWPVIDDPVRQADVWAVRKKSLGIMGMATGSRKPVACIEDACVPTEHLPEYIDQIIRFCKDIEVPTFLFAHASVGIIHLRPLLNLKKADDIENMKKISEYAFGLVVKYGGSWSGEHGDGRSRSAYLERFFGTEVYDALRQVKRLFDPKGVMNPGIIIDAGPIEDNLRYGIDYQEPDQSGWYHYRQSGSLAVAVEMCSGVGDCRQTVSGTMCPSFRVTGDERHSTRGRANAMRLALSGQLGAGAATSKSLYEVMDLCVACKSCKLECPSNVDLARLKCEFLQHYHDEHGRSLRETIVAYSTSMASLIAGWPAYVVNFVQKSRVFRKILEKVAGFDSRRELPEYSTKRFHKWFDHREKNNGQGRQKVVLFDDTYLSFHEIQVGISAVELLESCGYEVILARAGCCQRPRISHGYLCEAKRLGEKTLRNLDRHIQEGLKVVVCEPGCASALTDDLPDLIDDTELAERVRGNVMMIDVFLLGELEAGRLNCEFGSEMKEIVIHGHCHQKALYGTTAMKRILDCIDGLTVSEIDSGCCGMAGSFGYETEHYDMSLEMGEDRLFPAVRNRPAGAAVVACGFSCRHQIIHGTGVKAVHWVETLRGKANNANS